MKLINKLKEEKELSQWTFRPNVNKSQIDSTLKVEQVPGIYSHLKRWKMSYEKEFYVKHYYDYIGTKYTGKPTEMKPFNITVSREAALKELNKQNEEAKTSSPHKSTKNLKDTNKVRTVHTNKETNKSSTEVKQTLEEPSKLTNSNENLKIKEDEDKFAKLKIHYAKK